MKDLMKCGICYKEENGHKNMSFWYNKFCKIHKPKRLEWWHSEWLEFN